MVKGIMRQYHTWLSLGQRFMDVAIVFLVLMVISHVYLGEFTKSYQIVATLGVMLTWISMGTLEVYRAWRGSSLWQVLRTLLLGWLLVVVALILLAWATKQAEDYSRVVMGVWFALTPVALVSVHIVQRFLLRYFRTKGLNTRRVVIVGAGDLAKQLIERIQQADWMGVELVGLFDDAEKKQGTNILNVPVLGKTKDVYHFVESEKIDHVYFALPMRSEKRMREVFDELQDTTASLYLIPDLFIFELMGARQQDIAGLPAIALCETPFSGAFGVVKRLEDIILATLSLITFFVPMIVIAVVIKATSKGPVLFKQVRYGLNGERIKVYKFRSMTTMDNDDTVIEQATQYDIRITKFGMFLRRTSLDELPQFINVLQGRMSVVGPRPHAVAHNEQYRKLIKGYMWRHKVKPGITGWAQVNGWRGETDTIEKMKKRVEYDLDYIRRWSLWFDLRIFFSTMFKGFVGKNTY